MFYKKFKFSATFPESKISALTARGIRNVKTLPNFEKKTIRLRSRAPIPSKPISHDFPWWALFATCHATCRSRVVVPVVFSFQIRLFDLILIKANERPRVGSSFKVTVSRGMNGNFRFFVPVVIFFSSVKQKPSRVSR